MAGSKCHAVKLFTRFHYPVTCFPEVQQIKHFDASKLYDSICVGGEISTDLIVLTCAVFCQLSFRRERDILCRYCVWVILNIIYFETRSLRLEQG